MKAWTNEEEYRFLSKESEPKQRVGRISGVYFGDPSHGIENLNEVASSSTSIKSSHQRRQRLLALAKELYYIYYFFSIDESDGQWKVIHNAV